MKNIIFVAGLALALAMPVQAADAEAPKTKRVCVDVKDKQGQPVKNKDGSIKQNCRDVKQHKKHEGTKVPDKK
jgi:opacity protein-like surface antigen